MTDSEAPQRPAEVSEDAEAPEDARKPEDAEAPEGLAFVGASMGHETPRRRRRWLVLLLAVALIVPLLVCVGVASSVSDFVHRDPPPDLESPAVVRAQADAIRRTDAALATSLPRGATPITTGRYDACFRGSRQLKAWDHFDWVCATRGTTVLAVPQRDLSATLHAQRDRLSATRWSVATDRLDSEAGPVPALDPPAWNIVEADQDGTRLAFSYGPATASFVSDALKLERVEITAWADPHWEIPGPGLDRDAMLAALAPDVAFVVITAQHIWFAN